MNDEPKKPSELKEEAVESWCGAVMEAGEFWHKTVVAGKDYLEQMCDRGIVPYSEARHLIQGSRDIEGVTRTYMNYVLAFARKHGFQDSHKPQPDTIPELTVREDDSFERLMELAGNAYRRELLEYLNVLGLDDIEDSRPARAAELLERGVLDQKLDIRNVQDTIRSLRSEMQDMAERKAAAKRGLALELMAELDHRSDLGEIQ
jgi:hypothetical protein